MYNCKCIVMNEAVRFSFATLRTECAQSTICLPAAFQLWLYLAPPATAALRITVVASIVVYIKRAV